MADEQVALEGRWGQHKVGLVLPDDCGGLITFWHLHGSQFGSWVIDNGQFVIGCKFMRSRGEADRSLLP
jgi:hypothetical protein